MREGRIIQEGSPEDVYSLPISPTIAASTGEALLLEAARSDDGSISYLFNNLLPLETSKTNGQVVIRPEEIKISRNSSSNSATGKIAKINYYGHDAMITVKVKSQSVIVRIPGPFDFQVGEEVSLEHTGPMRFFPSN
jgi:iron(III) transport system ATP-binding protein